MESGVYQIINIKNNKRYIGSTTNMRYRWSSHKSKLKLNIHPNKKLLREYQEYGKKVFIYYVLEYCKKEELLNREQYYLDLYKGNLYNIYPFADSPKILKGAIPWNKGRRDLPSPWNKKEHPIIICKQCGKEFSVKLYKAKLKRTKFCSKKCSYQAKIGSTPWNKGKKGIMKATTGSFKKGNIPWNKKIIAFIPAV